MVFVRITRSLVNAMVRITAAVSRVSFSIAVVGSMWCSPDLVELRSELSLPNLC